MLRKRCFLPGLLLVFTLGVTAQNYTISGYVQDRSSGEKMIGATVYDFNSGKGTSANEYGFYSLTLPAGEMHLQVSYVGYTQIPIETPLSLQRT